jgi:hypothetical protein
VFKKRFPCPHHEDIQEEKLHSVLTSALDKGKRLTSCPGCFICSKEPRYQMKDKMGGPHRQSGNFEAEEILLPTY